MALVALLLATNCQEYRGSPVCQFPRPTERARSGSIQAEWPGADHRKTTAIALLSGSRSGRHGERLPGRVGRGAPNRSRARPRRIRDVRRRSALAGHSSRGITLEASSVAAGSPVAEEQAEVGPVHGTVAVKVGEGRGGRAPLRDEQAEVVTLHRTVEVEISKAPAVA